MNTQTGAAGQALSVALDGWRNEIPSLLAGSGASDRAIGRLIAIAFLLVTFTAPAVAQGGHPPGRGIVARVMAIRPRFPDGFGPPPLKVHPAVVRPGLFAYSAPIREVVSAAADRLAGTNAAGDLYVRAAGSDEKRVIARAEAPWR